MKITFDQVQAAHKYISSLLPQTPLLFNSWLSDASGCKVYLKLENTQPIGSFKIRGATYRISKLTPDEKGKGVITASAGNHAQGVAWGARQLGVKATIVMPRSAPLVKIQNTRALGAVVFLEGDSYEAAFARAKQISAESGKVYIPAFEDRDVICGQGGVALEMLEQKPDLDVVIGAVGGGGLMAGVGLVYKKKRPQVKVVGCQASQAAAMMSSVKEGHAISLKYAHSFADGISLSQASEEMRQTLTPVIDQWIENTDDEIAAGVLHLMEKAKVVAEGAGAAPLAAFEKLTRGGAPAWLKGKNVALVVSGGNIDVNVLARIIDRGLVREGRRLRVNVVLQDRPGSLAHLTELIAAQEANVIQAIHDRNEPSVEIDETGVALTLETHGPAHSKALIQMLRENVLRLELGH